MAGGQCGFAGHMTLPDNCKFGGKTGVSHKLKDTGVYIGYPAVPQMQFFKSHISLKKLPDMEKELQNLQNEIEELKKHK